MHVIHLEWSTCLWSDPHHPHITSENICSPLQDFDLVSEPLPELKEGEILIKWFQNFDLQFLKPSKGRLHKIFTWLFGNYIIRPEFWSVDPYARIYPISFGFKLPMTMLGSQVIIMTMLGSQVFLPTSQAFLTGLQLKIEVQNNHHHIHHDHGHQVSEVLESRNPRFPPGSYVVAYTGWRELAVVCYHHHCHHHCHHTGCFFNWYPP